MASRQSPNLFLTSLKMARWRNFKSPVNMKLRRRAFLVGPNASGKSNILDALRFLRDVVSDGLQTAVQQRGGMSEIRTLQATRPSGIELGVTVGTDEAPEIWSYLLKFRRYPERGAPANEQDLPEVMEEEVYRRGKLVLKRPDAEDKKDRARLTQTHLEQTVVNRQFRELNAFLRSIRYLHIVPRLVRDPEHYAGGREDPSGSDFLKMVASAPPKSRTARLRKINEALRIAVPQFESLDLRKDKGKRWHLEARFRHWRPQAGKQYERAFSDGTLRLIGLLWSLMEGDGPLLLEEPELSLHNNLVRHLPSVMARIHRKSGRQTLISTHSSALLEDEGIAPDEVHILVPTDQGTEVQISADYPGVEVMIEEGMTLGDVILPEASPRRSDQFSLVF